jgi:LysM repeat protein/ABC-type branched-subunit amino acid transport system substrate-binding protein
LEKLLKYIVGITVFFLVSGITAAQFQPTPVVRSQEKTIVDGKIYYIHTVLKGQTLYSISKAYEVTQDAIKNANPQVDVVNLVEGLAIRIPMAKLAEAPAYPQNKEDFYAHSIKRKETIYSLSKKYDVEEEVIYYYNPWAKNGIQQNQTLWIPRKKQMLNISQEARADDTFYLYTVKQKDTLYSISKTYGVEITDIINANPELRNGMKPGQVIKIPKVQMPAVTQDSIAVIEDMIPCSAGVLPYTYNVALMLPFFSSYNSEELVIPADSLAEEGTYVPQHRQLGLRGRNFAEFYEGFLLAVDSLKKTGMSLNLHVFDTERDTMKTKRIVRELSNIRPDMIVGPVYSEDVNITGRFAQYQEVNLISPLSTRTTLASQNDKIIQVIPPRQAESYALAHYLQQYKKGRIVLIRGTDSLSMNNSWRFKKYLLENMPVNEAGLPLQFTEHKLNDSLYHVMSKLLSKDEENLVVVFSENEPQVSLLISRLIQRTSIYPVVLFGMPAWQSWTNIDLNFYHNLQLHILSPFYTDFTNSDVQRYLQKSRDQYGYEPYEISPIGYNFSMLGYDIGLYFLSALNQFGRNFQDCLYQLPTGQLLTDFNFRKNGPGGQINYSYNIIRYRSDFTVEKLSVVSGLPVNKVVEVLPADSIAPLLPPLLPQ